MFIEKKNLLIVYLISYIKIEFIGFFKKIDFFFGSCFSRCLYSVLLICG